MSDTPETDVATLTEPYQVRELGFEVTHVDFARNLERQRNEALQLAIELRDALEDALSGGLEGPTKQAYDDGFLIIIKANQLLKQPCN